MSQGLHKDDPVAAAAESDCGTGTDSEKVTSGDSGDLDREGEGTTSTVRTEDLAEARVPLSAAELNSVLTEWHNSAIPLLDLRPTEEYTERRIDYSVGIPYSNLVSRLHELPDRSTPLAVLVKESDLKEGRALLEERKWKIAFEFVDGEDFWQVAESVFSSANADALAKPENRNVPRVVDASAPLNSRVHLFSPSPFLQECVERIESELGGAAEQLYRCCDVGCGSG
eukprot:CAMPEP_0197856930 /NCGR_PEP_ID=MMETSP1438-20131217/29498_1 /TAXON_ID=1461541 /ORGANISM="Pterosperma sp., Strain CCMP1384" /LENGTH=226 /DNA_ID=CAMNT_0043472571 /DNA_START=459 /DNA_END=1136 /DNA_ORIENTATION=-